MKKTCNDFCYLRTITEYLYINLKNIILKFGTKEHNLNRINISYIFKSMFYFNKNASLAYVYSAIQCSISAIREQYT